MFGSKDEFMKSLYLKIFILVLDVTWLFVARNGYKDLVKSVQQNPLALKKVPALFAYGCLFLSIWYYAIPVVRQQMREKKDVPIWQLCLVYGGGLGICIYGIYNFTNMAIFDHYKVMMGLKDTLWGGMLFTLSTAFYFLVLEHHANRDST